MGMIEKHDTHGRSLRLPRFFSSSQPFLGHVITNRIGLIHAERQERRRPWNLVVLRNLPDKHQYRRGGSQLIDSRQTKLTRKFSSRGFVSALQLAIDLLFFRASSPHKSLHWPSFDD
jgi:hypothetical protein